ncbi:hypothetical protein PENTCL1PPCAC_14917, partial [Pristionchus entomophagus]
SRQPRHPLPIGHLSSQPLYHAVHTCFSVLPESRIGSERELALFESIVDSDEAGKVVRLVQHLSSLYPSNVHDVVAEGARQLPR